MKHFHIILSCVFCSLIANSQDFSNKGKDFWLCFPSHVPSSAGGGGPALAAMSLFITSDQNSTGTVRYNGQTQTFSVTANTVTEVPINRTAAYITDAESNSAVNKGIHVTTDAGKPPVVVYAHVYAGFRTEATLVLPTNVLGKRYRAISYFQNSVDNSKSQFQVIAVEANTIVQIQLIKNGVATGTPFTINLPNVGDVYQIQDDEDLSGTFIESIAVGTASCKRIAVFSGSSTLSIGSATCSPGSYDPLFQQCYPISTWGKKYGVIPIKGNSRGYHARVMASEDNTTVNYNGTVVVINKGEVYPAISGSVTAQTAAIFISADKPILVSQYLMSQACANSPTIGDPDMIILNPVEQNIDDITIFTSTKQAITQQHMNVLIKTVAAPTFRINGAPPSGTFQVMPSDPTYSYLQETFPTGQGSYTLTADSGFNAICYGLGNAESYGYSAGTNVKDLYNFIAPVNPLNISSTPNIACACTPFFLTVTFPYQPDSIRWNFNGFQTPNIVTLPAPLTIDSTYFINGKQVWRYRIGTPYTYCPAGNYPISITSFTAGTDGCGNFQVRDDTLYVKNNPGIDFNWINNGCVTDSVRFRDNTVYDPGTYSYRWEWDFGDGNTSTAYNPSHKYAAPGIYTVSYKLVSNVGCISGPRTKTITVTDEPIAQFSISNPLCESKPISFTNSSVVFSPGVLNTWYWDYGDGIRDTVRSPGNPNRTHSYNPWGPKTASLKVATQSGCLGQPTFLSFTVHPNPVANFNLPGNICLPYSIAQFTDASTIADGSQAGFNWLWTFGDPASGIRDTAILQNPTHLYTGTGPFAIKLKITSIDGCTDDTTRVLSTVYPHPTTSITVNPENCLNIPTNFTSGGNGIGSTITNYYWDFGDGTPIQSATTPAVSHTYSTAQSYTIRHWILTNRGCFSDTVTTTVLINALPVPSFTFTPTNCANRPVTFTNTSTTASGNIVQWIWNFGLGRPDTTITNGAPFNYTYSLAGTYPVSIKLLTDKGCRSNAAFVQNVVVNLLPDAGFINPEVCLTDAAAIFIDTSHIGAPGTIVSWDWNFGDPSSGALNTSTQQNPSHRYNSIGNYTAVLIVTSNFGCTDTSRQSFTVNGDIPVAKFKLLTNSICATDSVVIQDTATVNFGNVTKVQIYWDNIGAPTVFETDDTPVPGELYKHLYPNFQSPNTKTYQIRYVAYSGASCVDDTVQTVTIKAVPKTLLAAFPNICLDAAPLVLTQGSTVVPGPAGIEYYTGPGITGTNVFHPDSVGPGVYTIWYHFTSIQGCADSIRGTIRVLVPPVATFTASSPICATKAVTFTSTATSSVGTIVQWIWHFGDGTPDSIRTVAAPFTHVYTAPGTFSATLTVVTSNGCRVISSAKTITVNPLPVASATYPASICLPNAQVAFTNTSSIIDGTENSFTYFWNFGDPTSLSNTSVAKNPSHTYSTTGPYTVQLTVRSGAGCVDDTLIVVNRIHPQPVAGFRSDSVSLCVNQQVQFIDTSRRGDGNLVRWDWDFGDGTDFSGQVPPRHTYNTAQSYSISLTVEDSYGCKDTSATRLFTVYAYPVVDAGPDFELLEGDEANLQPMVTGNGLQYLWTPPTYLTSTTIATPIIRGATDDIRYLLTVTAAGGCRDTSSVFVRVLKTPVIPNTFTPNNDRVHDFWAIDHLYEYPNCYVQIFNRVGQLVYESRSYPPPPRGWDGNYNGKPLPFGTYYYIIEPGNGRKPMTGYVTILK